MGGQRDKALTQTTLNHCIISLQAAASLHGEQVNFI